MLSQEFLRFLQFTDNWFQHEGTVQGCDAEHIVTIEQLVSEWNVREAIGSGQVGVMASTTDRLMKTMVSTLTRRLVAVADRF